MICLIIITIFSKWELLRVTLEALRYSYLR